MSKVYEAEIKSILSEVRRIEIQSRRLVYDVMAGAYRSAFRGAGIEFDEVREYVEGDDPRSVDWNVTARVGRPYVKKYVDERELSVLFLVDLSPSMDGGFGNWTLRQAAARLVAHLAISAVRAGDQVGMIGVANHVTHYVEPSKGLPHALRLVRDVLATRPSERSTHLKAGLEFATRAVRRRSILFLISDFLAENYTQAVSPCAHRHDLIGLCLLAPERDLPSLSLVRAEGFEGEGICTMDWQKSSVRDAYNRRAEEAKLQTERAFREASADFITLNLRKQSDSMALVRPLLSFFRARERAGARR
mgnify:CR=1 FL=1